nr:MAG TPA: hypothetical protein [Caudoviricetes sp.]
MSNFVEIKSLKLHFFCCKIFAGGIIWRKIKI